MAAEKNNAYWQLAEWTGAPRAYEPWELWQKACEYFQWCDENPWYLNEAIKSGEHSGDIIQVPAARPYTITGFCIFAGIAHSTFNNYSDPKKPEYEDFLGITDRIKAICYTQKLEGAMVGAFNGNIVAREIGLADRAQIELSSVNVETDSPEQSELLAEVIRQLNAIDGDKGSNDDETEFELTDNKP